MSKACMGDNLKELEATWDKLAKIFNNWAGIRPRKNWVTTGLTERAGHNRLRVLEDGKEAEKFYVLTKDLNDRDLRYLLKRAELNFEQAYSAARLSTVLNGTILIGFLVLFNQIFPGVIGSLVKSIMSSTDIIDVVIVLCVVIGVLIMIIVILSYSYGGTAQARDLKHLLELSLARREYYDGKRHHGDTDTEPGDILRESYITDI